MSYCPKCAFDLSSIVVKPQARVQHKAVERVKREEQLDEEPIQQDDDNVDDIVSKIVLKKRGGQTIVARKVEKKQADHLVKARQALADKRAQKAAAQASETALETAQASVQEQVSYKPLYNLF